VVAKDPLEAKAKALGGTPRGLVERVALPLQPAVTEIVEGVAREQVDGLGGGRRTPQLWAEPDVADLNRAEGGLYPQVGGLAQRTPRRERFDRVKDVALGTHGPGERLAEVRGTLVG